MGVLELNDFDGNSQTLSIALFFRAQNGFLWLRYHLEMLYCAVF